MVGWHHKLNGHEFEQSLEDSEGQGSLECCSPKCCKELDITQQLNNKDKTFKEGSQSKKQSQEFTIHNVETI